MYVAISPKEKVTQNTINPIIPYAINAPAGPNQRKNAFNYYSFKNRFFFFFLPAALKFAPAERKRPCPMTPPSEIIYICIICEFLKKNS